LENGERDEKTKRQRFESAKVKGEKSAVDSRQLQETAERSETGRRGDQRERKELPVVSWQSAALWKKEGQLTDVADQEAGSGEAAA